MTSPTDVDDAAPTAAPLWPRRAVARAWTHRDTVLVSTLVLWYALVSVLLVLATVERTGWTATVLSAPAAVPPGVQVPPAV